MKLKDLINTTETDVCIIDSSDEMSLILRINTYCVNERFWLTDTALEQEVFDIFTNEKYPGCICAILGEILVDKDD